MHSLLIDNGLTAHRVTSSHLKDSHTQKADDFFFLIALQFAILKLIVFCLVFQTIQAALKLLCSYYVIMPKTTIFK